MTIKFENITFIIPTNKEIVQTLESIPKEPQIQIRRRIQGDEQGTLEILGLGVNLERSWENLWVI